MDQFLARFGTLVTSVLSGLDRLVFRGTLIALMRPRGMHCFLRRADIRFLDFPRYAREVTEELKAASLREAEDGGRPVRYLRSARICKEDLARRIAAEHPVDQGLVCAFRTVEPCTSFEYHRSKDPQERGLKPRQRKCLHIYKYYVHPRFGWVCARIQTWFPFAIQICLNGREWLAQEFQRKGRKDFEKHDNCFTWLGNPALAQRWMNRQLKINWTRALDSIAANLNPIHRKIFEPWPQQYYWSTYQSEWATDLLFESPKALASIYPALVRHAFQHSRSDDVMRFLGRKIHGRFAGELTSSFKNRPEGVRVKHWVKGNSIKMYDKAEQILRVETTLADPKPFKVYRTRTGDEGGAKEWRQLRKGVADIHRRCEISDSANGRYLDALSETKNGQPLESILDQVAKPVRYHRRRVRALRIGERDELRLLQVISDGAFTIAGFRNSDIRQLLHPSAARRSTAERRRVAARISRQLRVLRAHGIIRKVQKSYRYQVTAKGARLTTALFAARKSSIQHLLEAAA